MAQTRNKATKKAKMVNAPKPINKKTTNRRTTSKAPTPPVDIYKLFPPWGSEEALNQTANQEATDILLAVYHDINAYCNLERLATEKVYGPVETFSNLLVFTEGFVEREIGYYMSCVESFKAERGEFQLVTPNSRFFEFVTALGWKMFAICSHAEAFRRGIKEADDRTWGYLVQKIQENFLSIELFAHSRTLKWRNILWVHQGCAIPGLPDMKADIETHMAWKVDHPHHTIITLDGKLKEPTYNGKLQEHINESIYDPKKWSGRKQDPTLRQMPNGNSTNVGCECALCGSPASCDCRLTSRAGELVELREYPNTGTGVRALTRFMRGDILEIFMVRNLCTICPHQFGNWTRYVSHSCRPSTQFTTRTIGDRVVCTLEAIRDILPFEEITVGYGDRYWSSADYACLCGHCDGSGIE